MGWVKQQQQQQMAEGFGTNMCVEHNELVGLLRGLWKCGEVGNAGQQQHQQRVSVSF
jgi:hypothetical protein